MLNSPPARKEKPSQQTMNLVAGFLGLAFACYAGALAWTVWAVLTSSDSTRFYATWGAVLSFAVAIGVSFAAWLAYQEVI